MILGHIVTITFGNKKVTKGTKPSNNTDTVVPTETKGHMC